ncbi:LysR family transcriptional regulator [Pyramidobacter sp. SM-530-WT-4B]|uniref:LysR family transcriptional regulator n=1 Tax=Pyramidobacter porci TaxID=2605789 RepID=A0A6L5YD25_9BACT|nr:LysR family transcriptional regulator [Pyramidobacter porci]MST56246.1 LysR family transcriptional regulator [Pyramidobacter porci]
MELNLREINYVLSIKSEGSVTKAARALHIAQPSLTQSLKKIEKRLGAPLFDRSSGSMRLTYAGERFVAAGLKILQISRDLENEIHDILKNDAGRILLGITLYLGSYMFTRIKKIYSQLHPNVELQVLERTSAELERLVLSGELDTAILPFTGTAIQGLAYEPLFKGQVLLMMQKGHHLEKFFYRKDGAPLPYIDIKLLGKEPFIESAEGQRMNQVAEKIFEAAGINPPIVFKSRSIETIKRMASAGIGLAFLPDYYRNFIDNHTKASYCLLDKHYIPDWHVCVVYQDKKPLSPILKEFTKILKAEFLHFPENYSPIRIE